MWRNSKGWADGSIRRLTGLKKEEIMKEKDPPIVKVKPHSYQPSKAELDADISINATPEDVAKAVMKQVTVQEVEDEKSNE